MDLEKGMKATLLSAFVGVMVLFTMNASATTLIGTITDSDGNTPLDAIFDPATGKYEYYIPLSGANGTYGVSGYGTTSDTASAPFSAPTMDMYFNFDIAPGQTGTTISLWTDDLDLTPYNDPNNFFERMYIHNDIVAGATPILEVNDYTTLGGYDNVVVTLVPPGDQNSVMVTFNNLNIASGSYSLHLGFQVYDELSGGTWTNTAEHISATMETAPVPEPSSLILMISGIVGIFTFRKKTRKNRSWL